MSSDFADEAFAKEDANDVDIVVVGAGLTGLTAAYDILRRKTDLVVLILESHDRIGGRLLSRDFSKAFYANTMQKRVTQLLDTLKIPIHLRSNDQDDGGRRIFFTKRGPIEKMSLYHAIEVHNFLRVVHQHTLNPSFETYTEHEDARRLATISVDQLLNQLVFFSRVRSLCGAFIYSACGIRNLREISALWLFVMLNGAGGLFNRLKMTMADKNRYFVQGGMIRIAEELLKRILSENGEIRYSEPVNKIQFNNDRAYVLTTENRYKCDTVIIAVPPPKSANITIEPLESQYVSKSQLLYTEADDVFFKVHYRQSFWNEVYNGDVLTIPDSNSKLHLAYDATSGYSKKEAIIAGFLGDSNATSNSRLLLFETLNRCFRNTEAMRWTSYEEFDLSSFGQERKFEGGSMNAMQPSNIDVHINPMNILCDRIFFAASEYATNWPGTVEGAIEAGEMSARSVLLKIRPQALNFADIVSFTKSKKSTIQCSYKIALIQYLCLTMNTLIFFSVLQTAYKGKQ